MDIRKTMASVLYPGAVYGAQCVRCKSIAIHPADFRDALSWREFGISSFCQKCQDFTFGVDND